jgi:hypothetical protein
MGGFSNGSATLPSTSLAGYLGRRPLNINQAAGIIEVQT